MIKTYSIIIPTFNCCELLKKTLNSIFMQDRNLFECIIVDGESTDNTLDIILEYKNKYPNNIKFISEPDKGIYDAMNNGIDLAEGDYLYFIGAGDTLVSKCLEKIKKYFNNVPELVYGNVVLNPGNYLYGAKSNKKEISIFGINHQAIFYNKKIFHMIGKYDLKYKVSADSELNIRCFANDNILKKYINETVAVYAGDGFSSQNIDKLYMDNYKYIIEDNLGENYYNKYYLKSGKEFYDVIIKFENKKCIVLSDDIVIAEVLNKIESYAERYTSNFIVKKAYNILKCENIEFENIDLIITACSHENKYRLNQILGELKNKIKIVKYEYFIKTAKFLDYIKDYDGEEIIIFGTGSLAKSAVQFTNHNSFKKLNIKYFLDNNKEKHLKNYFNNVIYHPNEIDIEKSCKILVASTWYNEITNQLIEKGIDENNIITVTL